MAIIKPLERFIPSPPARQAAPELRTWLHDEFERLSQAINSGQSLTDELTLLNTFGLLDGPLPSVVIPDAPDFSPALNYPDGVASGGFIIDQAAGTIQIPEQAGWLEITLFFSLQQNDTAKDFTVVVHLEIDGVPLAFSSGAGYIPTQERDLALAISTVKMRPTMGGETFRLVFQVLDDASVSFDIRDSSFRVKYIQLGL